MNSERVFGMAFSTAYLLLAQKAERKGRTKAEVDDVIRWLDKLVDELARGRPMEKILRK